MHHHRQGDVVTQLTRFGNELVEIHTTLGEHKGLIASTSSRTEAVAQNLHALRADVQRFANGSGKITTTTIEKKEVPLHQRPIRFWELTIFLAGGSALIWLYAFVMKVVGP